MFEKYGHKIVYWSDSCDDGSCGGDAAAADDDDDDDDDDDVDRIS
jgi:hypothetical protein